MKVAIIVTAVNLWNKYTLPCLETIKTKYDYRILLIDNASTDETREGAGKLVSDKFSHKRNEEMWCCAKSWNFGVADAFERGYDYVLILNNDVLLHPQAIDRLVDRFESHVHPPVVMVTMNDVTSECPFPMDIHRKDPKEKESVQEAEHPCFSGFMLNKECWEKVGPFDEEFKPCYFEDNDYHHRINAAGMKAIVLPAAMMYHFGSATQKEAFGGIPVCTSGMFEKNRDYYVRKWGGMPGHETFNKPFNA